jgi:hypothetical protein
MQTGSAAHELILELRYLIKCYSIHSCISAYLLSCLLCDRSDSSLDFIAVYNASNHITNTVSLLQRTGAEEYLSEEPLMESAALEIQSTRSSMSIEGKMLLGHFLITSYSYFYCDFLSLSSYCVGPPQGPSTISKIP